MVISGPIQTVVNKAEREPSSNRYAAMFSTMFYSTNDTTSSSKVNVDRGMPVSANALDRQTA